MLKALSLKDEFAMADEEKVQEFSQIRCQIDVTDAMTAAAWHVLQSSGWLDHSPPGPGGLLVREMLEAALSVAPTQSRMQKLEVRP